MEWSHPPHLKEIPTKLPKNHKKKRVTLCDIRFIIGRGQLLEPDPILILGFELDKDRDLMSRDASSIRSIFQIKRTQPSFHHRLRTLTRSEHVRLDLRLTSIAKNPTRDSYIAALRSLLGFFVPMERVLGSYFEHWLPELRFMDRRRVPMLVLDLLSLGVEPKEIASTPRFSWPSWVSDIPTALGSFYVLERLSLAGPVIGRRLEHELELTPDHGSAFFRGRGPRNGPLWRSLLGVIDKYCDGVEEETIDSARRCFAAIDRWAEVHGIGVTEEDRARARRVLPPRTNSANRLKGCPRVVR